VAEQPDQGGGVAAASRLAMQRTAIRLAIMMPAKAGT